LYGNRLSIA
jgi:hypothetical protein